MHLSMLLLWPLKTLQMNGSLPWQRLSLEVCAIIFTKRALAHICCSEMMNMLRKLRPNHKFIEDCSDERDRDLSTGPNQRGEELQQRVGRSGYTPLEETIAENISALWSLWTIRVTYQTFLTLHSKTYLGNVQAVLLPANTDHQTFHSAQILLDVNSDSLQICI